MALRVACTLLAALAASPAGAELAGRSLWGHGTARIEAGVWVSEKRVQIAMQFGPSFDCFARMPANEFTVALFASPRLLTGRGSWQANDAGRLRLVLDPASFENELANAYQTTCEETSTPAACADALAALEPRIVRSRLVIHRLRRDPSLARLHGLVALELVDPANEAVAFRWSLSFDDAGDLRLQPPAQITGFCMTWIGPSP